MGTFNMQISNSARGLLLAALALAIRPALANSTVNLTVDSAGAYGYYTNDNITINGSTTKNVYLGGNALTDKSTSQTQVSWCVDYYHDISLGSSYTFNVGTTADMLKDGFTQSQINSLRGLANNSYGQVNNRDSSSAFQLAVWAILYGNGPVGESSVNSIYTITNGSSFKVSGLTKNIADLAFNYLTSLSTPTPNRYQMTYLFDGLDCTRNCFQDQLAFTPSPVPLPAALPLMASGIGLLGFAARRKKKMAA